MSATASEMVWVAGLLEDLKVDIPKPVSMFCDNKSAEFLAHNSAFHERTKHIKRDFHYVREQVDEGFLDTIHVPSSLMNVDVLTKALPVSQHYNLLSKLGLVRQSSLRGGI